MLQRLRTLKIVQSFLLLKGNTRTSVMFEPLFAVSFSFYNFYLSLYMKEMGVTGQQFGGIIAVGFISGAVFSLFGGVITDHFGRKKTTLLFDLLAWPFSIFIYFISRSYVFFLLATAANNTLKITTVAWNLMVVEDADSDQRKAAYNILNIISIAMGIITPLAGLFVARLGIIRSERIFMVFAMVSMTTMIFLRNRYYTETRTGQRILAEHKGLGFKEVMKNGLYGGAVRSIFENDRLRTLFMIQILFSLTLPLGAYSSLYFAPYMTDVIGFDKASVSILGSVYAAVMLFVFLVINPAIPRTRVFSSILTGLVLQGAAQLSIALMPNGFIFPAILAVALYAFGYSVYMPFFTALFADISEGNEIARVFAFAQTVTSALSAVIGAVSGFIYEFSPRLIFLLAALCLAGSVCVMTRFVVRERSREKVRKAGEEQAEQEAGGS